MDLNRFSKFQQIIANQAIVIAQEFTKDQKTLMCYFVNSNQELLCMSHISAVIPKHEDYKKVITELVSFGLLIETVNNKQKAFKKGKYFPFFEDYFRK